jgi:hypothetical protein
VIRSSLCIFPRAAWIDGGQPSGVKCRVPVRGKDYFRFLPLAVIGSRIKTTSMGALTSASRLSAV